MAAVKKGLPADMMAANAALRSRHCPRTVKRENIDHAFAE